MIHIPTLRPAVPSAEIRTQQGERTPLSGVPPCRRFSMPHCAPALLTAPRGYRQRSVPPRAPYRQTVRNAVDAPP